MSKPYYVFRPRQAARRARAAGSGDVTGLRTSTLPWGWPLTYPASEQSGVGIARRGLFDITVSEVLWRLAEPGEVAVDVGANVGHMTSLLACRLGDLGRVHAFEPHPELLGLLRDNVDNWTDRAGASVDLHGVALTDHVGTARLAMPAHWSWNRGSARIDDSSTSRLTGDESRSIDVPCARLDGLLDTPVGVMKIDVEGHEHAVLSGAARLLESQLVRDVVFEDWDEPPTATAALLRSVGYEVLSLDHTLLGPRVGRADHQAASRSGDDPSYIATLDPDRARRRLAIPGWCVLGHHRVVETLGRWRRW